MELPFAPSAQVRVSLLEELGTRLSELTREDVALTSRQCELRLERGDVLNAIVSEGGDEAYAELVDRAGLSEQQAGQERWVSARVPDYARKPSVFSWTAHREVAALEPGQITRVFEAAEAAGQSTQRAVREIARAMFGEDGGSEPADPQDQDWPSFLRMALVQHFAGRLSDKLIGEVVIQVTRFQKEWEKAKEVMEDAA